MLGTSSFKRSLPQKHPRNPGFVTRLTLTASLLLPLARAVNPFLLPRVLLKRCQRSVCLQMRTPPSALKASVEITDATRRHE